MNGRRGPLDRLVIFTTIIIVNSRIRANTTSIGALFVMYRVVFPCVNILFIGGSMSLVSDKVNSVNRDSDAKIIFFDGAIC